MKKSNAKLTTILFSILFVLLMVTPAFSDQVILDDLIVDGSECIGVDCVIGEAMEFDTLRLKENNLRIDFRDTSTSGSFPSNDWRIVANHTTNGGDSYFAIEDVTAGTIPFRVDAVTGNVGVGTDAPQEKFHVVGMLLC